MKIGKKFRFQCYLDRVQGRKVLWMPRKEWEGIKPFFRKPVKIDVAQGPLRKVFRGYDLSMQHCDKAVELGVKVKPEFLGI